MIYSETITVPVNVSVWQSVCQHCRSRVALLYANQPGLDKPPFRFCCLCGAVAVFYRLNDA